MAGLILAPGEAFWQAMLGGRVRTLRDPAYLRYVARLPCVITGKDAHVHHMVGHGLRGEGQKTSDYLTFPLAPELHTDGRNALHVMGHLAWESKFDDQRIYVMQTLVQAVYEGVLEVKRG